MVEMTCYIDITSKKSGIVRTFQRIHSVQIKSSRKTLTDTAIIKLANVKSLLDGSNKKISVGDKVEISLGYNGSNNLEFTGYVSEIKASSPLEIMCEDEMWQLKQEHIEKGWKKITLKEMLNFILPNSDTSECPDIDLSPFTIQPMSKAKALEKLKDEFGIDVYFRDKKLFAGVPYTESNPNHIKYHFQKNVPTTMHQSGLTFKKKEDVKIKFVAVSKQDDNKEVKVELGDDDGEIHTLHVPHLNLNKEQLMKIAQIEIDKLKYTGYRGVLKTFGMPIAKHNDVAELTDALLPDKNGKFFIDSVETNYGPSGFNRQVELGLISNSK